LARPTRDAWYTEAAEDIVWTNVSVQEAAAKLGHVLTGEEAARLAKTPEFQRAMTKARNEYYAEIGRNPGRTKAVVLGRLDMCAEELMKQKSWDKAAEVLLKLAKVEGYVGGDTEVSVFAGLTQKEIDEVRARVTRAQQQPGPVN